MHLSASSICAFFGLASTSSAAFIHERQSACPSSDYVFEINNFFLRKLDGQNIAALGFNIVATNGGSLNFTCTPSDSSGNAVSIVTPNTYYSCGLNSAFSFSFDAQSNGLLVKYGNSVGTAAVPNVCRAGGSSSFDQVCTGTAPACITVVTMPTA